MPVLSYQLESVYMDALIGNWKIISWTPDAPTIKLQAQWKASQE